MLFFKYTLFDVQLRGRGLRLSSLKINVLTMNQGLKDCGLRIHWQYFKGRPLQATGCGFMVILLAVCEL